MMKKAVRPSSVACLSRNKMSENLACRLEADRPLSANCSHQNLVEVEWQTVADAVGKVRRARMLRLLSESLAMAVKLSDCYCWTRIFPTFTKITRLSRDPTFSTVSAESRRSALRRKVRKEDVAALSVRSGREGSLYRRADGNRSV